MCRYRCGDGTLLVLRPKLIREKAVITHALTVLGDRLFLALPYRNEKYDFSGQPQVSSAPRFIFSRVGSLSLWLSVTIPGLPLPMMS